MSYNDVREMIDTLEQENKKLRKIAHELYNMTREFLEESGLDTINAYGYDGTHLQRQGRAVTDRAYRVLYTENKMIPQTEKMI